jgi:hypothetical protein
MLCRAIAMPTRSVADFNVMSDSYVPLVFQQYDHDDCRAMSAWVILMLILYSFDHIGSNHLPIGEPTGALCIRRTMPRIGIFEYPSKSRC